MFRFEFSRPLVRARRRASWALNLAPDRPGWQSGIDLAGIADKEYTRHPVYGVRRMTLFLRQMGHWVNVKRVRRLLG